MVLGSERLDDTAGDLVQQGIEGLMLPVAEREGVPYLLDEGRVALGQHTPGERAGLVTEDDRSTKWADVANGLFARGAGGFLCHGVQALRMSLTWS